MAQCFAKCTHCGAILQMESTAEAAVCPVCNAAFSVEKAIRNYYGDNGVEATKEDKSKKRDKKFNVWAIVAVVLAVLFLTTGVILVKQYIDNEKQKTDNNNHTDNSESDENNSDDDQLGIFIEGDSLSDHANPDNKNDKSDPDALNGRYVSKSGLYEIEFEDDFTCRWYQDVHGNHSYFDGTYEKDGDIYVLYMQGGNYSYNTRFEAEPVKGGLIITGGLVDGEFFEKQ